MGKLLRQLWRDDAALSALEYAILAAVILVALIAAIRPLRDAITTLFARVTGEVTGAGQ